MVIEIVFWSSVSFIFYAYLGYPFILKVLCTFRNRPVHKGDITPTVTCIITAYNSETLIREKIENTLKQDYTTNKLEIIVASDCSADGTDAMVRSYESHGVQLRRALERIGKEGAQKLAVNSASGEILVFSDVSTMLPSDGISSIGKNFIDPTVGCVSSVDRFVDAEGKISGEGAYVRYEMGIRNLETKVNTLVGLSGSFFAVRREVCQHWAIDLQSDFNTLLCAVKMGLRGVADPDSAGYYKNVAHERTEYDRKVRTVLRGISVLTTSLGMLNPFRYGLFSWQLFSHKLCRWLVPFAMITAFLSNALLVSHSNLHTTSFAIQILFYMVAILGIWTDLFRSKQIMKIPSFFVLANLAILQAWFRYFQGQRLTAWNPSSR